MDSTENLCIDSLRNSYGVSFKKSIRSLFSGIATEISLINFCRNAFRNFFSDKSLSTGIHSKILALLLSTIQPEIPPEISAGVFFKRFLQHVCPDIHPCISSEIIEAFPLSIILIIPNGFYEEFTQTYFQGISTGIPLEIHKSFEESLP